MSVVTVDTSEAIAVVQEPFSLTKGSLIADFERSIGPYRRASPNVQRGIRVGAYFLLTWIVPLLLAMVGSPHPSALPFGLDIETHVRGMIAIPILVLAERPVSAEVGRVLRALCGPRHCRHPGQLARRFHAMQPLVSHPAIDVGLIIAAYLLVPQWIAQHTPGGDSWVARWQGGRAVLTLAGTWQAYVAVPAYLFLLLRWLWRWFVLFLLFLRAAPLGRFVASHGDGTGGLSFVSHASARFAWPVVAASCVASSKWLNAIMRMGASPKGFTPELFASIVISVGIAFLPLFGFTYRLMLAKRAALRRYRAIVSDHGREVERMWARSSFPKRVQSEQASSMTDLNSVFDVVRGMRLLPFRERDVLLVAAAALAPMLPVIFYILPIEEVVRALVKSLL